MESSTKRIALAIGLCMLFMIAWLPLMNYLYPPPPPSTQRAEIPTTTQPVTTVPAHVSGAQPAMTAADGPAPQTQAAPQSALAAVGDPAPASFELGRDEPVSTDQPNQFWVWLKLTSAGASIDEADLTPYFETVGTRDTYDLLARRESLRGSFATAVVHLIDEKQEVDLASLPWRGRTESDEHGERVVFEADITRHGEGVLRLRKTWSLARGTFDVLLRVEVENISAAPVRFTMTQLGPAGMRHEGVIAQQGGARYNDLYVLAGRSDGGAVRAVTFTRDQVSSADQRTVDLVGGEQVRWIAQVNKWFACVMAPVAAPAELGSPMKLTKASAFTRSEDVEATEDLEFSVVLQPEAGLAPGARAAVDLDLYLGPKDHKRFEKVPKYEERNYTAMIDVTSTSCALFSFGWLISLMRWFLDFVHGVLPGHNYGLAIILMVLVVRLLLHGLSKRTQLNTMRVQKKMAALQPKIAALKARYANDPTQLQQEQLKLMREEGISPFAQMSSCVPMLIQMPIWVALWTTLNSSIDLRHESFVLWMKDLAAPDALIAFGDVYHIPLLSYMMGPVYSLNVLPIVMAITMYLQQKLMQKLTKPDAPAKPAAVPVPAGQVSAEEQLRQQQKIMSFMTVFFGLMFYNFPCGLNLYIFTSNLFGMAEQWQIRKRIRETHALDQPQARRKLGKPGGWLDRMREALRRRFDNMQKAAEEARRAAPRDRRHK